MKSHIIADLPIKDIELTENNTRGSYDEKSITELAGSIEKNGVLQPIIVMSADSESDFEYRLICGHRRYKAAKQAGLRDIPANFIETVSDEEILELQITENLERKDVHPLDEAQAFKKLLHNEHTIADIAEKFVKSWTYIAHRLKLLELIEPIKKDFFEGKLPIGHAVLLARSSKETQEKMHDEAENGFFNRGYGTYSDLKDNIEDDTYKLSKAPFSLEDKELYPEAVACSVCPKRSGCNPKLFPEFQEDDVCFDRKCYDQKVENFLQREVARIVKENESIVFLQGFDDISDDIKHIIDEFDIKVYKRYHDFSTCDKSDDKAIKGLVVSGFDIGHYIYVRLHNVDQVAGINSDGDPVDSYDVEIARLRERNSRSNDLDDVKIIKAINEEDKTKDYPNRDDVTGLTEIETKAFWYAYFVHVLDWSSKTEFEKKYGIDQYSDAIAHYNFFNNIESDQLDEVVNYLIRLGLKDRLSSETEAIMSKRSDTSFWFDIMQEYATDEVGDIVKKQQEKAAKRDERFEEKVAKLKSEKEEVQNESN